MRAEQWKSLSFKPFVGLAIMIALLLAASPALGQEECVKAELDKVRQKDLPVILNGIGTLQALQEVTVKSEIGGSVQKVHFRDGQRVEEGDLLVSLDAAKLRKRLQARKAGLSEAEARMKNARRSYKRQQNLFDKGVGSEQTRDEALTAFAAGQAQVDRLEAEIEEIEENLLDTRIRAPFGGILGESLVESGDVVQAGTPLVPLTRNDELEVAFTVSEKHITRVNKGQKVSLTMPGYPERSFSGKITFLNPVIDRGTRSLRMKANVENSQGRLLPGGFASVRLTIDQLENATVIPEEALIPTRKGYMVFTVQNGTAQARDVRIGLRKPGIVEIREGIKPGETVISTGHISVQDGSRICGQSEAAEE
ncbi:MAG: efflux RND transporter periplasmic adaptor subunit [Desulfohalobiaceae bacterium]